MAETSAARFGRSLRLEEGDLRLAERDLVVITGRENFSQALRVMAETQLGSDVFNTGYGLDLLGILQTAQTMRMTKELIRLNIVKSISQDNRVRAIKEVVFDDDPRFFEILASETPDDHRAARKSGRHWQVVVLLTTIGEQDLALKLEGAA
jgi:phage baseplate assembly protein W